MGPSSLEQAGMGLKSRKRRFILPPDVLEPVLVTLFKPHADLKCHRKKFNAECHKAAALMIGDVRKGWVSGVALYNILRTNEKAFQYTTASEPIRLTQWYFRAVEMTVALLSDFCYRKNVESGSQHRDEVVYDGHYDPWIEDDIDIVYQSVPFDSPRQTLPGYINVSLFKPTEERFIISELPQKIRDDYNIPPHDHPILNQHILQRPLVDLSGARTDRYTHLSTAQNTKFALVPIHTNEEYRLFNREALKFIPADGQPDFKGMAKCHFPRNFQSFPAQLLIFTRNFGCCAQHFLIDFACHNIMSSYSGPDPSWLHVQEPTMRRSSDFKTQKATVDGCMTSKFRSKGIERTSPNCTTVLLDGRVWFDLFT
ncbi:hypothetical protein DFH09DRAFT_1072657 [Mycena vulgaris]|nr:hypothetical protein DFH09DRAFT_1072657 [Mycena vulgaris]